MSYVNIFDILDKKHTAVAASTGRGVDNSVSGRCPKCKEPFGTANLDVGLVYYCNPCKVALPITE